MYYKNKDHFETSVRSITKVIILFMSTFMKHLWDIGCYHNAAYYWNILISSPMGQSMDKPTRVNFQASKVRLSARSLQRSSYRGTVMSKRTSLSASKIRNKDDNEPIQVDELTQNTRIRNEELFINSRFDDNSINLKELNTIRTQKVILGGQNEISSPNFREIAQPGQQYGLPQWTGNNVSKEVSHNQTHHHEITISFSKAKNNPNMFHEEPEFQKSKLNNILDQEETSVNEDVKRMKINSDQKINLKKELQVIANLKSIYSENYRTPSIHNTPKKSKQKYQQNTILQGKQSQRKQSPLAESRIKKQVSTESKVEIKKQTEQNVPLQANIFNDYETAFHKNQNDAQGQKKPTKISKKMQELKQKIANRYNMNKQKMDMSRYSMERLSASLRKYRNTCSFEKIEEIQVQQENNTQEKIKKMKEKLCKTHHETIQSIENITLKKKVVQISPKTIQTEEKKDEKHTSKKKNKNESKKQELKKVKSDQNLQLTRKLIQIATKKQKKVLPHHKKMDLFLFNEQKVYLSKKGQGKNIPVIEEVHNINIQPKSQKKISFTEMVKKEHYNNKQKKSRVQQTDPAFLKFSQVQEANIKAKEPIVFSTICDLKKAASNVDYEFFDYRQGSKMQRDSAKLKNNQMNSLKKITEQLNTKNSHKKSSNLQSITNSKNNSTEQHSYGNKTFQQKYGDSQKQNPKIQAMSFIETKGNVQEYMLKDAIKPFQEGKQSINQEKRKSKSSEHSGKLDRGIKNKLIIF